MLMKRWTRGVRNAPLQYRPARPALPDTPHRAHQYDFRAMMPDKGQRKSRKLLIFGSRLSQTSV